MKRKLLFTVFTKWQKLKRGILNLHKPDSKNMHFIISSYIIMDLIISSYFPPYANAVIILQPNRTETLLATYRSAWKTNRVQMSPKPPRPIFRYGGGSDPNMRFSAPVKASTIDNAIELMPIPEGSISAPDLVPDRFTAESKLKPYYKTTSFLANRGLLKQLSSDAADINELLWDKIFEKLPLIKPRTRVSLPKGKNKQPKKDNQVIYDGIRAIFLSREFLNLLDRDDPVTLEVAQLFIRERNNKENESRLPTSLQVLEIIRRSQYKYYNTEKGILFRKTSGEGHHEIPKESTIVLTDKPFWLYTKIINAREMVRSLFSLRRNLRQSANRATDADIALANQYAEQITRTNRPSKTAETGFANRAGKSGQLSFFGRAGKNIGKLTQAAEAIVKLKQLQEAQETITKEDEILMMGRHMHGVVHALRLLDVFQATGKIENCDLAPTNTRLIHASPYPFFPPVNMSSASYDKAMKDLKAGITILGYKGTFKIDQLSNDYIRQFIFDHEKYKGNVDSRNTKMQQRISSRLLNPLNAKGWFNVIKNKRINLVYFGVNDLTVKGSSKDFDVDPKDYQPDHELYVPESHFNNDFLKALNGEYPGRTYGIGGANEAFARLPNIFSPIGIKSLLKNYDIRFIVKNENGQEKVITFNSDHLSEQFKQLLLERGLSGALEEAKKTRMVIIQTTKSSESFTPSQASSKFLRASNSIRLLPARLIEEDTDLQTLSPEQLSLQNLALEDNSRSPQDRWYQYILDWPHGEKAEEIAKMADTHKLCGVRPLIEKDTDPNEPD